MSQVPPIGIEDGNFGQFPSSPPKFRSEFPENLRPGYPSEATLSGSGQDSVLMSSRPENLRRPQDDGVSSRPTELQPTPHRSRPERTQVNTVTSYSCPRELTRLISSDMTVPIASSWSIRARTWRLLPPAGFATSVLVSWPGLSLRTSRMALSWGLAGALGAV